MATRTNKKDTFAKCCKIPMAVVGEVVRVEWNPVGQRHLTYVWTGEVVERDPNSGHLVVQYRERIGQENPLSTIPSTEAEINVIKVKKAKKVTADECKLPAPVAVPKVVLHPENGIEAQEDGGYKVLVRNDDAWAEVDRQVAADFLEGYNSFVQDSHMPPKKKIMVSKGVYVSADYKNLRLGEQQVKVLRPSLT